jgi:hypothetical protein
LIFTPPTPSDDCDPEPQVIVDRTETIDGPGFGETTYIRYWYAVDACGNESDMCSQTIVRECPEPCTFTIGGWGTECPESQAGDMYSTQPGCIRDHYFAQVFPGGEVVIGHASGYTARWTSSAAVAAFLPDGSTPSILTSDLVNPTTTPAGILASQILALRLNREYSCAGIFSLVGLSPGDFCYGDYVIPEFCGKFAGLSVDEFLQLADLVVSGNLNVLNGYSASVSDVNYTASCLNEQFSECDPYAYIVVLTGDYSSGDNSLPLAKEADEDVLPTEYELKQNYPNPFNPTTAITLALPVGSHVKLEIYNILGQQVITLADKYMAAGYHTITWNAGNAASGIYFYKLQTDEFTDQKKMILLK